MLRWVAALGTGGIFALFVREILARPTEEDEGEDAVADPTRPPFPAVEIEPGKWLASEAGLAFRAMRDAAYAEAGVRLPVSTAWRSREWQQQLYDAYMLYKSGGGPWAPMAAKPGGSLHEKGIAVDLHGFNPNKPNYDVKRAAWMESNAERFNFFNTGAFFSSPEPWHWVYGVRREGVKLTA
jgi:LAS superfamily LD-carboxypeptidase LdcB